jgi:hypothetical protein
MRCVCRRFSNASDRLPLNITAGGASVLSILETIAWMIHRARCAFSSEPLNEHWHEWDPRRSNTASDCFVPICTAVLQQTPAVTISRLRATKMHENV